MKASDDQGAPRRARGGWLRGSIILLWLAGAGTAVGDAATAEKPSGLAVSVATALTNTPDAFQVEVKTWPADNKLALRTPLPNVVAAYHLRAGLREPLAWVFNPDASQLHLETLVATSPPPAGPVFLETIERTTQLPDGRIIFSALDAQIQGDKARRESNVGNHRVGFWTQTNDAVTWAYQPTRWGRYDVEVAFAAEGGEGTELAFEIAGETLVWRRPATGSWYRYVNLPVGRCYLSNASPFALQVRCRKLVGSAVVNLKAVILRPAPEGNPIVQDASGTITLHARDATVHGVTMRYEPATNKNCLGYWVNARDWADWAFTVNQPGTFEVEVWQGCGQGQGGSDVVVEMGNTPLPLRVMETGHFQIFVPRSVGQVKLTAAGTFNLTVRPVRKQASAIMDIRQVRLLPVGTATKPPRTRQRDEGPIDAEGRPLIRKLGTVDLDMVEATPVVFNGRLWRFEWVRQDYWDNARRTNYFRLRDPLTGEVSLPFGDGLEFGSAFVQADAIHVTGVRQRSRIEMLSSRDLKRWETRVVLDDRRYGVFNTSLCQAGGEFVLMFEIDRPQEEAGTAFTARFLRSRDLRSWTLTPPACVYAKDRYTAPHCLRWLNGWFYDFYLEAHNGYEMRVVRSRDLIQWESSPLNPVLRASPEDKIIANQKISGPQRNRIAQAVNLNNSDIDFCEWQGQLRISYSWGNQLGVEHLAEATYEGTQEQFLRGWFPGK